MSGASRSVPEHFGASGTFWIVLAIWSITPPLLLWKTAMSGQKWRLQETSLLLMRCKCIYVLLYNFELFSMACDLWPLRRNFASADASGTRDMDEFWLSACSNFGHLFSCFWNFFVTYYMSQLANISVTRDNNWFWRQQEGPWPVTCWTIWNGTVL